MYTKSRDILWVWLAVALAVIWAYPSRAQEPSATIRNLADNKFAALPGLPDCWTAAVQRGDPAKGSSVMLIKGTAGCAVTWHWHSPNEHIMLVSGTATVQMKDDKSIGLRPGAFALMPAHHVHRFSCVLACTSFLYSDGAFDIHWVDATGKDISAEEALKAVSKGRRSPNQR